MGEAAHMAVAAHLQERLGNAAHVHEKAAEPSERVSRIMHFHTQASPGA